MSEKETKNQQPKKRDNRLGKPIHSKNKFGKSFSRHKKEEEFQQKILDIARVTRVMAGGKRMSFRVCLAIGNKKGKVGVGVAKGVDIALAAKKATKKAEKNMVDVPILNNTIPHDILHKYGAAKILFKPAKEGRGVIAGGVVRVIFELAGVKNVTSKILGTNNKTNNAKCTIEALRNLKKITVESNKKTVPTQGQNVAKNKEKLKQ